MNIATLQRKNDDGKETIGTLTFGSFSCDTLERPWKDNAPSISCIPPGQYICSWSFMHIIQHHYEVKNVPQRSGIFIHVGNYFTDTEGCILLGQGYLDINNDGEPDILNSKATLKKFEELMQFQPFELNVVDIIKNNKQNNPMLDENNENVSTPEVPATPTPTSTLPEGQKRILKITKIETVVTLDDVIVDASGTIVAHNQENVTAPGSTEQIKTFEGSRTLETIIEEAKASIEPDSGVEVVVADGVK